MIILSLSRFGCKTEDVLESYGMGDVMEVIWGFFIFALTRGAGSGSRMIRDAKNELIEFFGNEWEMIDNHLVHMDFALGVIFFFDYDRK